MDSGWSENPTVKVRTGRFRWRRIRATLVEESMPPESSTPKGTSDIILFSTAASSSSRVRRTAKSRSAGPDRPRISTASGPAPGRASQ